MVEPAADAGHPGSRESALTLPGVPQWLCRPGCPPTML